MFPERTGILHKWLTESCSSFLIVIVVRELNSTSPNVRTTALVAVTELVRASSICILFECVIIIRSKQSKIIRIRFRVRLVLVEENKGAYSCPV